MSVRLSQPNIGGKAAAQFSVVLLLAALLKLHYATASVNDLRWILLLTKTFVELITGISFAFEPHAGYMSADRSFLIAGSCAGVNFLVAAFLMLSLGKLWKRRGDGLPWFSILASALLAFAVTIVANTLRISSALWLNSAPHSFAGMTRDEIHRLDGILIYFGILLLVFVISERRDSSRRPHRYMFPLAIYYAVTLAIPIANGAFRQGDFWQHALFVLATPILLIAVVAVAIKLLFRDPQRKDVSAASFDLPRDLRVDEVGTRPDVRDAAAVCGAVGLE